MIRPLIGGVFGILMYEMLTGKPPFRGGNRQKIQEKIVKDKIKLPGFFSSEANSLLKGNFPGAPTFLPVVQFVGQHPGGLGVLAVGMILPVLAGATGDFGWFILYHNGWCLSCYAIWPDLCIASYKTAQVSNIPSKVVIGTLIFQQRAVIGTLTKLFNEISEALGGANVVPTKPNGDFSTALKIRVIGLGICLEVVKNKLAPAMKKAELEIECGGGKE
ncbi:unnamed protein product [Lactuca saligna]|uniref:Protein kinase domain-containing protein n=1 Tax=Lactuca saligna TaxID=75948 RepID=A0AA35YAK9_LACSI|nr:unnamed protein product [Lactuca saligna]